MAAKLDGGCRRMVYEHMVYERMVYEHKAYGRQVHEHAALDP
jgi:hypothetical protein